MWKEYVCPNGKYAVQRYLDFISIFPNVEKLHTSGHASAKCLADVCNLVDPTHGIIPIHSEKSDNYRQLNINDALKRKIITTSQYIEGVEIVIF